MPKLKHPTVHLLVDNKTPVAEVIVYARHIGTVFPNDYVKTPSISLTTLASDNDALHTAEGVALTRARGSADARDRKLSTVFTDLGKLRTDAQTAIDADPAHAAEIAAACAMSLRKPATRQKAPLSARMTKTPGLAKLMAKAVKRGASYEWQMSTDEGKTFVTVAKSTVANTTVPGLTAGSIYMFRIRTTVGQVTSDWGNAITFMAH